MRTFGHKRPVRDKKTKEVTGMQLSPVAAITVHALGDLFGCDKKKRLVVTLADGDVITFRPERSKRTVSIKAVDVYRYAIDAQARKAHMARMSQRKAVVAAKRERSKLNQQERRFKASLRKEATCA